MLFAELIIKNQLYIFIKLTIEGWGKMGYGGKWDAFIFFYLMACQRQTIS